MQGFIKGNHNVEVPVQDRDEVVEFATFYVKTTRMYWSDFTIWHNLT